MAGTYLCDSGILILKNVQWWTYVNAIVNPFDII